MADLELFREYQELADRLIEAATKEELAETARLLALNVAHYQSRFGELPLEGMLAMLSVAKPNEEQAALLASGMETLVGVLGLVRSGGLEDEGRVH
jgi:hypothetical protein